MKGVFEEAFGSAAIEHVLTIRFVLGEQQRLWRVKNQLETGQALRVPRAIKPSRARLRQLWFICVASPTPSVSKPDLRELRQRRCLRAAIPYRDSHQHVIDVGLCILHKHIEVAVGGENAGVHQLIFPVIQAATVILIEQLLIGKRGVRILVQHAGIGAAGRSVEIVIELFDILAVIPLAIGEPKKPLFKNRVFAVPHGYAKTERFFLIAKTGNTILTPSVGSTTSMIMREIFPCGAVGTVVLANRSPLPLAEIGTPAAPRFLLTSRLVKAVLLSSRCSFICGGSGWRCHCGLEGLQQPFRSSHSRSPAWQAVYFRVISRIPLSPATTTLWVKPINRPCSTIPARASSSSASLVAFAIGPKSQSRIKLP